MYSYICQDYLIHHGVKGMRWGVRHDERKIHRNERYRQKLLARSNSELESNRKKVARYRKQYSDIRKNGVDSKLWQKQVDKDVRGTMSKAKNVKGFTKAFDAETKRYSQRDMEHYKLDLKFKVKDGEKATKDILERNKTLSNMKIDANTSKGDIRKAYYGNRLNMFNNVSYIGNYTKRIDKIDKQRAATQIGSLAGAGAGLVASRYINKYLDKKIPGIGGLAGDVVVTSGSIYVGQMLGRYGGSYIDSIRSRK